jgi:hypothetical protein
MKEAMKRLFNKTPPEQFSMIFAAGLPLRDAYLPSMNVGVAPLPINEQTLDQAVEGEIRNLKLTYKDYQELSRIKTTVEGREATIMEFVVTLPEQGKFSFVSMYLVVGKTVWNVTCTCYPEDFDKWKGDFQAIVRSLRILK